MTGRTRQTEATAPGGDQRRVLEGALDALRALVAAPDLESAGRTVIERCLALCGARAGIIMVWERSPDEGPVLIGISPERQGRFHPRVVAGPGTMQREVLERGTPLRCDDFAASPWAASLPPGHPPIGSAIFVPLRAEGGITGLLGLFDKPGGFSDADEWLIEAFAEALGRRLLRLRTEEALAASERLLRGVFETVASPLARLDARGTVIDCNRRTEALFGWTVEELRGRPVTDLIHPDDHPRLARDLRDIFDLKTYRRRAYRALRADGTAFDIEVDAASLVQSSGAPEIVCQVSDVTARRRAERLEHLAHDLLLASHRHGDLAGLGTAFCRELCRALPLAGASIHLVDDRGALITLAEQGMPASFLASVRPRSLESHDTCTRFLRGEGEGPYFTPRGALFVPDAGAPGLADEQEDIGLCLAELRKVGLGAVAVVPIRQGERPFGLVLAVAEAGAIPADIVPVVEEGALQLGLAMRRILVDRRLQEELAFRQALLDGVPVPICHRDPTRPGEVTNRAWTRIAAQLPPGLLEGTGSQAWDATYIAATGQVREIEVHQARLDTPGGGAAGTISAIVDVTALKAAARQVQDLNRSLEERVQARVSELQALYLLSRELVHVRDAAELARVALHHLPGALPADRTEIVLWDGARAHRFHRCGRLALPAAERAIAARLAAELERLGMGPIGRVEPCHGPHVGHGVPSFASVFLVPILAEGRSQPAGILLVADEQEQRFTEDNVRMLRVAASQIADAAARIFGRPDNAAVRRHAGGRRMQSSRALLHAMPVPALLLDAHHRVAHINRAALALFGIAPAAAPTQPFLPAALSWDWPRVAAGLLPDALCRAPVRLAETRYQDADGRTGLLDVTLQPLDDGDPGAAVLVLAEDVGQRQALDREQQRTRRLVAIGQLAAGIAHEVNTPAQFVGDNLHFLRDSLDDLGPLFAAVRAFLDDPDAAGAESALRAGILNLRGRADLAFLADELPTAAEQALDGIQRIANIVGAMREFAHGPGNEPRLTDVNRCVRSTVTVARSEWKQVAEVTLDLDPDLPQVITQPAELNQIILNLLTNAAHAIAERPRGGDQKGKITVVTRASDGWVSVCVVDNGCGIPWALQHRVFEPFFTTKEVGRGTGQGLAISHAIVVDRLGGRIGFESTPDRGSSFTFRIPVER